MKIAYFTAVALLSGSCVNGWANGDEAAYKQRAAQADLSAFREMDRAGRGLLANRDEVVTLQELQAYIEKTYGVKPAPR
jgi:hypothetical protein